MATKYKLRNKPAPDSNKQDTTNKRETNKRETTAPPQKKNATQPSEKLKKQPPTAPPPTDDNEDFEVELVFEKTEENDTENDDEYETETENTDESEDAQKSNTAPAQKPTKTKTKTKNTKSQTNKKKKLSPSTIFMNNMKKLDEKNSESTEDDEDDEDDEDYDEQDEDVSSTDESDTDDSNDTSTDDEKGGRKDILILYGEDSMFDDEEKINEILNDEEEECNSEDEQTFMKENYEKVAGIPTTQPEESTGKKGKKNSKGNHPTTPSSTPEANKTLTPEEIDAEYKDLVELKKQLVDKLKKKNKNKVLMNAVEECKKDIHKLVLDTRRKNAKEYYQLISAERKTKQTELEYFKKKLSHKEQIQVMNDLKEVNTFIYNEKPYRLTLLQSSIPSKYKANVMQKMNMMMTMEQGDSEYHKLKMWIDTFMRIPFDVYKDLSISIHDGLDVCDSFMKRARNTLDECTYGLDNAKMQIMQLVGQWITNPRSVGTSIAIYGPKGTGKTSLAKEGISKIFGREFAFVSLGGAGDASFLEGHSYTYEGSIYGRIVQILMESKCMNPIIYFDELDKVSDSARGQEIISILTHLTDVTQNSQFHDKYFADIDFDLSRCLFIFSYNDEKLVNPILKDRMYHIQTKAYDMKEKVIIAKKYLLPKIREQVNFQETDIVIPDEVIQYIISTDKYTQKEEGVRNLKRCLEIIHTKLNLFRLMKTDNENIEYILGKGGKMNVVFPYTVSVQDVDILIKVDDNQIQSWLNMYV